MLKQFLKENTGLELKSGIYAVKDLKYSDYDNKADAYDRLLSLKIYNKLMWGNHPGNYTEFAEKSIHEKNQGVVLDIGCGPLSFTRDVYFDYEDRTLVISDLSQRMLEIAKEKLSAKKQGEFYFLQADALNFPFKDNSVDSILSFGFLHVVPDSQRLLSEFFRVLKKGGDLHLSVLCTDRKISSVYLKILNSKNLVSFCLSSAEIEEMVKKAGFKTSKKTIGGMVYIDALKP